MENHKAPDHIVFLNQLPFDLLFALATTNLGSPAQLDPVIQSEIDTLRAIEAHVEPSMVTSRKSDDKFALFLNEDVRPSSLPSQIGRRHGKRLVTQELVAFASVRREVA